MCRFLKWKIILTWWRSIRIHVQIDLNIMMHNLDLNFKKSLHKVFTNSIVKSLKFFFFLKIMKTLHNDKLIFHDGTNGVHGYWLHGPF